MKIESTRLENAKVFWDVHLKDIPSFLVVVGANGSGKSTLFDVFGFLHDCLKGVTTPRAALDVADGHSESFWYSIAGVERLEKELLELPNVL